MAATSVIFCPEHLLFKGTVPLIAEVLHASNFKATCTIHPLLCPLSMHAVWLVVWEEHAHMGIPSVCT